MWLRRFAIHHRSIDSAATGGGFVDEETGRGMKWAEKPSKTSSKAEGYGAGGSARYGKAIIAVGGVEDTFTVGVTADLNGKVSCLLGNEVLKRFKIVHDWDRRTIKPKDGREVKITMKTVKGAAHVAFIAKKMRLEPGEEAWLGIKAPKGEGDASVHVEPLDTARGIEALDGVSLIRDGIVYVPVKNFGGKRETLPAGSEIAKFTILKEVKSKKGVLVHKDLSWPSKNPEKEAKEREEGEVREAQRTLVTDEEIDAHLRERHGHLNEAEKALIKKELMVPFREIFMRKGEKPVKPIYYKYTVIRLNGGPVQAPLRYWSEEKTEEGGQKYKTLGGAGIMQGSESPWRSEWVLVGKDDGGTRATADLRMTVNKNTIFDAYPMPRIDEQQRKMAGCDLFTTCDSTSGYYHVGLEFESREATAMRVPNGLGEFTRLTMGGATSGASFVRAVEETIMSKLGETRNRTANYIDEFLTGGKQAGQQKEGSAERIKAHVDDMKRLFTQFQRYGWRISLAKLLLAASEAVWVGAKFRDGGIEFTDNVLQSITECREPKNVTELRRLMGLCAQFFQSVEDFRIRTKPLTKLQATKGELKFNKKEKEVFEWIKEKAHELKGKLMKIVEKNKDTELRVYSDASQIGIGGLVSQEGQFVGANSRTLLKTERAMSPLDREFLGVAEKTSTSSTGATGDIPRSVKSTRSR